MDRSRVILHPGVHTRIVITSSIEEALILAESVWRSPGILVLDGYPWTRPLSYLQRYQDPRRRRFDSPFSLLDTPKEVLDSYSIDIDLLLSRLFAGRQPLEIRKSWRPMLSGPEPLHFDTFKENNTSTITAYLNVSRSPRRYGVSHDFATLLRLNSDYISKMSEPIFPVEHFCFRLRVLGANGQGPLGPSAPRHQMQFASGAVWIFNPKLVSHELIHGDGAYCYSWRIKKEGQNTEDILKEVLR